MFSQVAKWLSPTVLNTMRTPVSREIAGLRAPVWTLVLLTGVKAVGLWIVIFTANQRHFGDTTRPFVWEQLTSAIVLSVLALILINPWWRIPDWFLHLSVTIGAIVIAVLLATANSQGTLVGNFLTLLGYSGYAALWFSGRQLAVHIAFLNLMAAIGVYTGFDVLTANSTWLPSASSAVLVALVLHSLVTEIQTLAMRDMLTGALNRTALNVLVGNDARGTDVVRPCCVVVCDLNDFKRINDTRGHLEGDRLLAHVAEVMRGQVRPRDFVVRSGGDEFLLLLTGTSEYGAEIVMKRIIEKLEVSIAYGIAQWNVDADFDDVVANADLRMYRDKAKRGTEA